MVSNVLLIVVDALRADRVYQDNDLMPEIDARLTNAEHFESCYACATKPRPQ